MNPSLKDEVNSAPTAPLYTELPYPADGVVRTTVANMLRQGMTKYAPSLLRKNKLLIADVGCGTGEITLGIARKFPQARVIGLDINRASLQKASELARKERESASFVRGDITGRILETLRQSGDIDSNEKFDVVTSLGALHHLKDPLVGFSAVREIIKPDGLFLCFIYSRMGRWDDIAVKQLLDRTLQETSFSGRADLISSLGLSNKHSVWDFLGKLRNRLRYGPSINMLELAKVFVKRDQLTHLSDTFSNPNEHLYTFNELQEVFRKTGWSFVALAEKGGMPVTPEMYTQDPEALKLLKSLPQDVLYDYFAYKHRVDGFSFFLRPA